MDVAIHLGAQCTDAERLLRSLLRNREQLSALGVSVPGPGSYRDVLREVMGKLRGEVASPDTSDVVMETVLESDEPARLILSNPNILSMPEMAVAGRQLYPKAAKACWLRNIFPDNPVEFFFTIRNPATFVPAIHALTKGKARDFEDFTATIDPLALRWSDTILRIRDACPDCPVTVWCHEDGPLIWGEVMRTIARVDESANLHGGFDMLRPIISDEGMRRLRAYTKAYPPGNENHRRRIVTAFLGKFGLDDEIEEELDLPGWTGDLVARMSADYEADMTTLAALPGVTLLTA